jgi:hypothetical protein
MDEREQRFVIKFLWPQGLGGKAIHAQLSNMPAGTALSLSTVQTWLHRFKEGNTSCEDANRLMVNIGDIMRMFLASYPFAPAKVMSRHFSVSPSTVQRILNRKLGFRKYAQQ